jgi:hypothetical protein
LWLPTPNGDALSDCTDRRGFLRETALFGAGALASQMVPFHDPALVAQLVPAGLPATPQPAPSHAAVPLPEGQTPQFESGGARGPMAEVYHHAREILSPLCRVCPQCDGVACAGENPGGIGGLGSGLSFQNNFHDLQQVKLKMRTLNGTGPLDHKPNTSARLFGHKLSFPAMAAPIGGVAGTFGARLPDVDYFEAIIGGCADAGTLGSIGDSPQDSRAVLQARFDVIGRHAGRAIAGIKPRPQASCLELIRMAEAQGAARASAMAAAVCTRTGSNRNPPRRSSSITSSASSGESSTSRTLRGADITGSARSAAASTAPGIAPLR